MGSSADRLASKFGVSRLESDKFALRYGGRGGRRAQWSRPARLTRAIAAAPSASASRLRSSHQNAARAFQQGLLKDLVPVRVPKHIEADNGVRGDTTLEKLGSLKPAFVKPHGTVTAGNASFLTDGASAALLMSEKKALELGYKPLAYVRDYLFVAQDPKVRRRRLPAPADLGRPGRPVLTPPCRTLGPVCSGAAQEELLLGPAYGIAKMLARTNTQISDYGVWELHEAFAGQVLANLAALESDTFAKNSLGRTAKVGALPADKINNWGGSLSIGHPFGVRDPALACWEMEPPEADARATDDCWLRPRRRAGNGRAPGDVHRAPDDPREPAVWHAGRLRGRRPGPRHGPGAVQVRVNKKLARAKERQERKCRHGESNLLTRARDGEPRPQGFCPVCVAPFFPRCTGCSVRSCQQSSLLGVARTQHVVYKRNHKIAYMV